ncbi:SMP-30/gluconolactonase/LRE family protein [Paramicrobacterium fandaimingii]|uniref:SMP-30/gluconolactonase/LRE family protein n=1 Tax=Paramicrobacterium fandaimingii TaxID=2708079 RepID=UPI001424A450
MAVKAEALGAPVAWHGEGPMWDAAEKRLLIVDMMAGAVVDLGSPEYGSQAPTRHDVGSAVAAALRPRTAGGFAVATEHGFSLFSRAFTLERRFDDIIVDPGIRMNEGGCDPQGRFYCGTMAYDAEPGRGELFRLDADGTAHRVFGDVTISNGLQWSDDGTQAYYNDTPTGRIDVFDFDGERGAFENRAPFVMIDEEIGHPDGLAVDAEGGVWTALWGGGAVRRYDSNGRLSEVVDVPGVTNTSACCFGGEGLRTLFITTSRQDVPQGEQPAAGAVFAVEPGVAGRLLSSFAG